MNLLLDALKPTASSPSASREPEEEPLDGVEVLKMLSQKAPVSSALTLEASPVEAVTAPVLPPDVAVAPPRETAPARHPAIAPAELASRAPNASAAALAPPAMSPARKYAVLLGAAVAVVIIVLFGKSILYPSTSPSTSMDADDSPPTATNPTAPPSTGPVQVPTRPASQFAYAGGAPEIDLREDPILPAAIHTASGPARPVISADTPEIAIAATAPSSAVTSTSALTSSLRTLTVTPSTGLSAIDRHVEAGYRALATGNLSTARREYLSALELDPKNVDALMGTASVAARDGNATVATAAYAKVLKLEPGNADATAALAILNHERPPVEASESRLKTMIASDAERRPALHTALAGVYAADARWADAAQEYFIALSLDPSNSDLAFNVAASLDQNHKAAAALTYYAQALALAKLRPAQIDVHAIEERIGKLQARIETRPATPPATP